LLRGNERPPARSASGHANGSAGHCGGEVW